MVVPLNQAWLLKSRILKLELVSRQKVCLPLAQAFSRSPAFVFFRKLFTIVHCSYSHSFFSTAISRRMATDQGGKRGPQSSRGDNHGLRPNNDRQRYNDNRDDNDRPTSSSNNNPNNTAMPPMPGFNFNFPNMPNGMPFLPPGFQFPTMPQQNGSGSGL